MLPALLCLSLTFLDCVLAQKASNNGRCGAQYDLTCTGTGYGQCCSSAGWCGAEPEYCGSGCQSGFGTCSLAAAAVSSPAPKPISSNTRCGAQFGGQTCQGSPGGNCCSLFGYCGNSYDFCRTDQCQANYGTCSDARPSGFVSSAKRPEVAAASCPAAGATITSVTTTTTTLTQDVLTLLRTLTSISTLFVSQEAGSGPTTVTVSAPVLTITSTLAAAAVTQSFTATITTTSVPLAVTQTVSITQTTTVSQTITNNPALINLGGNGATTTTTATITATSALSCPTTQPIGNGGFEQDALTPWIPLSAGTVTSGRVAGGASLSGYAFKFSIDATNPNLPQRLVQAVTLCPNSTYAMSFNARKTTAVGTISVVGSIQLASGSLVQMAGGAISSVLYAVGGSIGNLVVPAGTGPVLGVVVIEATFGPSGILGAKEVLVDEIVLTRTG